MNQPTSFKLKKWYLDAVDARGEVFIGYAAELRWNLLSIAYHGSLGCGAEGGLSTWNSFVQAPMPVLEDQSLHWKAPGIEGDWIATAAPIMETLFETPEGRIEWRCVQPRATADLRVGKKFLHGLGYVECIEMTVPPWKLPIHELRWGRFLSEQHHVVWIQWLGPLPKLVIHHNGARHEHGEIDETGLSFGTIRLVLSEGLPLRSGSLMSTVFARAAWIRKLLPLSILKLEERKWRSRGRLSQEGREAEIGWAIHETVKWM